ncbi:hypothetical protein BDZ91DRAFT_724134 [Kalaharituber pfeilii]|nr:hypothetical protein BDZ91DRAFT_724134 [Kalaharituber pfeilii]
MAGQPYRINRCCGMKGAHKAVESALPRTPEDHLLFFFLGGGGIAYTDTGYQPGSK